MTDRKNPIDVPFSNKFYEVQKYVSFTNHMADAWVVGINSRVFKGLDDTQKAGAEVQQWNVDMMAREDQVALKTLEDNGMVSNPVTPELIRVTNYLTQQQLSPE